MAGRYLARLLDKVNRSLEHGMIALDRLVSSPRRASLSEIRYEWASESLVSARRIAVLAHYDPHFLLDDTLVKLVSCLKDVGYGVLLVSTSEPRTFRYAPAPFRKESLTDRAKRYVDGVLLRPNKGKDIGSYIVGILYLASRGIRPHRLLLLNDSVYGPLHDLRRFIDIADDKASAFRVYGLTESYEPSYHFQTYFVLFNTADPVVWEELQALCRRYRHVFLRESLVRLYEVRLPKLMPRTFESAFCFFPVEVLARERLHTLLQREALAEEETMLADGDGRERGIRQPITASLFRNPAERRRIEALLLMKQPIAASLFRNPHHLYAEELHAVFDHPFVKRELLTANPLKVRLDGVLARMMADEAFFEAVIRHLGRVVKRR